MELLKMITDEDIGGDLVSTKIMDVTPRIAVRAVLINESRQMALLYLGKFDFYTIPGGGVENGESLEIALKREIHEETGCRCEIVCELGYVCENRVLQGFTQNSYYYIVKVVGEIGSPKMTEAERGLAECLEIISYELIEPYTKHALY